MPTRFFSFVQELHRGLQKLPACRRVKTTGGLVEEEKLGVVGGGADERHSARLALAEALYPGVAVDLEALYESPGHSVIPGLEKSLMKRQDFFHSETGR